MTQHDQQSSGVEAVTNAQPSAGRRRLVKGAIIAVPAIFTIRNGFAREGSMPSEKNACASLLSYNSFVQAGGKFTDPACQKPEQ